MDEIVPYSGGERAIKECIFNICMYEFLFFGKYEKATRSNPQSLSWEGFEPFLTRKENEILTTLS